MDSPTTEHQEGSHGPQDAARRGRAGASSGPFATSSHSSGHRGRILLRRRGRARKLLQHPPVGISEAQFSGGIHELEPPFRVRIPMRLLDDGILSLHLQ